MRNRFIGDWIIKPDPVLLTQAVFTHLWASMAVCREKKFETGRIAPVFGARNLEFLQQATGRGLPELAEDYFREPDLGQAIEHMMTPEALGISGKHIEQMLDQCSLSSAPFLKNLLYLIDHGAGKVHKPGFEPREDLSTDSEDDFSFPLSDAAFFASWDILDEHRSRRRLSRNLGYVLDVGESNYCWIGQKNHKGTTKEGFSVVHWENVAGSCARAGMVLLPRHLTKEKEPFPRNILKPARRVGQWLGLGRIKREEMFPGNTIHLFPEHIKTFAYSFALTPAGWGQNDLWEILRDALAADLALAPRNLAECFFEGLSAVVYWHEMGHLMTDEHVYDQLQKIEDEEKRERYGTLCNEINADIYALSQLQGDQVIKRIWQVKAAGILSDLPISWLPLVRVENNRRTLFLLRALFEPDPYDYLATLGEEMFRELAGREGARLEKWSQYKLEPSPENAVDMLPEGTFDRWLVEQCKRVAGEVCAILKKERSCLVA